MESPYGVVKAEKVAPSALEPMAPSQPAYSLPLKTAREVMLPPPQFEMAAELQLTPSAVW